MFLAFLHDVLLEGEIVKIIGLLNVCLSVGFVIQIIYRISCVSAQVHTYKDTHTRAGRLA